MTLMRTVFLPALVRTTARAGERDERSRNEQGSWSDGSFSIAHSSLTVSSRGEQEKNSSRHRTGALNNKSRDQKFKMQTRKDARGKDEKRKKKKPLSRQTKNDLKNITDTRAFSHFFSFLFSKKIIKRWCKRCENLVTFRSAVEHRP